MLKKKDCEAEIVFQNMLQEQDRLTPLLRMKELLKVKEEYEGAVCAALRIGVRSTVAKEENKNLIRFEIFEYIQELSRKITILVIYYCLLKMTEKNIVFFCRNYQRK